MNDIENKYAGHEREDEINELENLSSLYIYEFDKENNKLRVRHFLSSFPRYLINIILVLVIILFITIIYKEIKSLEFFDFVSIIKTKLPGIIFLAFLIVVLVLSRINAKYNYNILEIDFLNERLNIKNIDYFGKYLTFNFNEIRKVKIMPIKLKYWLPFIKTESLILEAKNEKKYPLFLMSFRKSNINAKRMEDLFNYILKL